MELFRCEYYFIRVSHDADESFVLRQSVTL